MLFKKVVFIICDVLIIFNLENVTHPMYFNLYIITI